MAMSSALTLEQLASLFLVLFVAALLPTLSGMMVAARSAVLGFRHGALVAAGIVAGDLLFMLLAIYGLSLVATWLGESFDLLKYLAGGYLVWLGSHLWYSPPRVSKPGHREVASRRSSFLVGLLVTLADHKAILFYLGLFPAFLDLAALTRHEVVLLLAVAGVAVGVPKLWYALLAARLGQLLSHSRTLHGLYTLAGVLLVIMGLYLLISTWIQ